MLDCENVSRPDHADENPEDDALGIDFVKRLYNRLLHSAGEKPLKEMRGNRSILLSGRRCTAVCII